MAPSSGVQTWQRSSWVEIHDTALRKLAGRVGTGTQQSLRCVTAQAVNHPDLPMNRLFTPLLQLFGKTLKDTVPAPVDR